MVEDAVDVAAAAAADGRGSSNWNGALVGPSAAVAYSSQSQRARPSDAAAASDPRAFVVHESPCDAWDDVVGVVGLASSIAET